MHPIDIFSVRMLKRRQPARGTLLREERASILGAMSQLCSPAKWPGLRDLVA